MKYSNGKLKYKKGEFFIPLPDNEPEFIGRDYGDGKTIDEVCEMISKYLKEKINEESKNQPRDRNNHNTRFTNYTDSGDAW